MACPIKNCIDKHSNRCFMHVEIILKVWNDLAILAVYIHVFNY